MANDVPRSESDELNWITHCAQTIEQLCDTGSKFETILITPPWPRRERFASVPDESRRRWREALSMLPVKDLLAENATVHLWSADANVPDSLFVLHEWGVWFAQIVAFLYAPDRPGHGSAPDHSLLLIAVHGQTFDPKKSIDTCIHCDEYEGMPDMKLLRELSSTIGRGQLLHILTKDSETGWTVIEQ